MDDKEKAKLDSFIRDLEKNPKRIEEVLGDKIPKEEKREIHNQIPSKKEINKIQPVAIGLSQKLEKQQETENKENEIKPLRTYEDDVAEIIKKQKESATTIHLAEQKRKRDRKDIQETKKEIEEFKSKRSAVLWISFFLIVAGLGALGYFYYDHLTSKRVVSLKPDSVIAIDGEIEVPLDDFREEKAVSLIHESIENQEIKESQFFKIKPLKKSFEIDAPTLLRSLGASAPELLYRSFADDFMLGTKGKNNLFLLIKIQIYDNAYAGMLKWENRMEKDLKPLLEGESQISDSGLSLLKENSQFRDEIIDNKDVRILYENEKNVSILWGFIDRETLVITDSKEIYRELRDKYLKTKLVR